jgi:hypothetical protein
LLAYECALRGTLERPDWARRVVKDMTGPVGEWPDELLGKAAQMLGYYQTILPETTPLQQGALVAGALHIFSGLTPQEAVKLVTENRDYLEDLSFVMEVHSYIEALGEDD